MHNPQHSNEFGTGKSEWQFIICIINVRLQAWQIVPCIKTFNILVLKEKLFQHFGLYCLCIRFLEWVDFKILLEGQMKQKTLNQMILDIFSNLNDSMNLWKRSLNLCCFKYCEWVWSVFWCWSMFLYRIEVFLVSA